MVLVVEVFNLVCWMGGSFIPGVGRGGVRFVVLDVEMVAFLLSDAEVLEYVVVDVDVEVLEVVVLSEEADQCLHAGADADGGRWHQEVRPAMRSPTSLRSRRGNAKPSSVFLGGPSKALQETQATRGHTSSADHVAVAAAAAAPRPRSVDGRAGTSRVGPLRPPPLPPALPPRRAETRLPSGAGPGEQGQRRRGQATRRQEDRGRICDSREHPVQAARHTLVPRRQLLHGRSAPPSREIVARALTRRAQGRDHTIHAGAPGYVRYYRDPHRHPKRKYIGIVFDKDQALPQPPHAARRRHLGMLAYRMPDANAERQHTDDLALLSTAPPTIRERPNTARQAAAPEITLGPTRKNPQGLKLTLRPGGQYRQANHEIGRAGDAKEAAAQAKGRTARLLAPYRPGDRFAAWRKSAVRMARNAERRTMGRGGKKK